GQATGTRPGGWGVQTFGGIEMAFKDTQSFVVSAEVIYFRLPVSIAATTPLSGVTTVVLFHFYLKKRVSRPSAARAALSACAGGSRPDRTLPMRASP